MSSLVYIIAKSAKNKFLELLRKPGKLALYLLVLALIAFTVIMSITDQSQPENLLDIVWLKGILFALILLFFIMAVQKGLRSGDVIFDMSDVNLLFVSPIRSQSILLYGVVRMAGTSFLAGFFILFQSHNLGRWFGVNFGGILLILAGFILAVSLMQVLSLLIYSLTNGRPVRKLVVKILAGATFAPMAGYVVWQAAQTGGDMIAAVELLLRSPITAWTPVVGWASAGTVAIISGDAGGGLAFFGTLAALGALLITYVVLSNPDYYEDVLVASETAFEKKRAMAEGQINTEATSEKNIKVAATGVGGLGASAIFYKHLRESFRVNRLGLWGMPSVIMAAGAVGFALLLPDGGFLTILQVLMWAQIFLIGTGRGLKELYSQYIYMIPQSAFSKVVWSNLEVVLKVLVESLFVFVPAGVILRESPLIIGMAIVVYTLFSLLLIGVNYLSLRWTGADMSAGILITVYIIAVIVIMLPGLVAAIVVGSVIDGWGVLAGLVILAAWQLIAAVICFSLSKGILHKCDMPVVKAK